MVLEHEPVDGLAAFRPGPCDSGKADHCPVARRLLEQRRELLLGLKRLLFEAGNNAHPPDTGGRNSTRSAACST